MSDKSPHFNGFAKSPEAKRNFANAAEADKATKPKETLEIIVEIDTRGHLFLTTPDGKVECHSEWQVAAILCRYAGHRTRVLQRTFEQTQTFEEWEKAGGKVKIAPKAGPSPKIEINCSLEELGL